jgi:signal transduction histidine kinase
MPPGRRIEDLIVPLTGSGARVRAVGLIATAFVAFVFATFATAADEPAEKTTAVSVPIERVLVIDQEGPTRRAFVQFMEGFRAGAAEAKGVRFEVFIENLDVVRLGRSVDDPDGAAGWLLEKYSDWQFDVIVPTNAVARDFVLASRERLSPEARIVAFERPGEALTDGDMPRDYTYVTSDSTLEDTVTLACRLFPGSKRIGVVGQAAFNPATMARYEAIARRIAKQRGLEYVPLIDMGLSELRGRLRDLPVDSVVVYYSYWKDELGQSYFPSEILESLCKESKAPVFGMLDTHVGQGTVGGACGDLRAMGVAMGRLMLASRKRPIPPPVTVSPVTILDDRALRRFRVPASRIPAGSRVLFREPRLWDRYRPYFVAGGAVLLLQSLLIVALVTQSRRRRWAEQIVAEQRDQITHAGRISTLGQLAASLAHELGQPLGAILNNLEAAEILLRDDASANAEELRAIVRDMAADDQRAGAVLDRIRAMIRKQRFTVGPVEVASLIRGVLTLAGPRLAADGIVVTVACDSGLPRVAGDEVLLQQALLNLLGNSADAIRASRAGSAGAAEGTRGGPHPGEITIRARRAADSVELAVIDNGGGVEEGMVGDVLEAFATTKDEGLGMGLPIVRSIVERHEGELRLDNAPGRGLTVSLGVPVWRESTPP